MLSVRNDVTYDNVICSNLCYTRKYDVLCPHLCYMRRYVMSEHVTHEYEMYSVRSYVTYGNEICQNVLYTQKYDVSELKLHTTMCNIGTYVPQENMMFRVRTYANKNW